MADNTTLDSGSGGDVIRSEDRSGVKTQVVGLDLGIGGATEVLCQAGQQTMAASLPVVIASNQTAVPVTVSGTVTVSGGLTDAQLRATPVPVSGTFYQATQPVSLASVPSHNVTNAGTFVVQVDALPAGLATSAKQDTGNTSLSSIDGKVPALGQALAASSVPVVLTAAQLTTLTPPAAITGFATQTTLASVLSAVDGLEALLAGTLTVTGAGGTFPVTGTFWQATQPGSIADGADVALGAIADATVAAGATGSVSAKLRRLTADLATLLGYVDGIEAQLAGTLTVTGTVTATTGGLTDTELRASAVPVSLASVPSHAVTGPLTNVELRASAVPVSLASVPSHDVTNAGAFVVQASQNGAWNISTVSAVSDAQVQGKSAHDAAATGNPVLEGGYASAAAPTDVNVDGDAVRAWFLRNGARACVLTAAGALIGGDATNGLDVDVTRCALPTGAAQEHTAANSYHSARLTDGGSFYQTNTAAQLPGALTAGGNLKCALVEATATVTVDSELPAAAALADATANPTTTTIGNFPHLWDEGAATWERQRGNTTATVLSSAARTGTTTSSAQVNRSHRGVILYLNVSTNASAVQLDLYLEEQDPVSGSWAGMATIGPYTTTGLRALHYYPGASGTPVTAGSRVSAALCKNWRVTVTHVGAGTVTYSVGANLIL